MVEKKEDFGKPPPGIVARWLAEDELYQKEYKEWLDRAEEIEKRYRDERTSQSNSRKLNLLWSNIQILQPALYDRPPKPEVQRRFKDRDPIGRTAAEIVERAAAVSVDTEDFDETMQAVVLDRLLGGRGVAWVRYEVERGPPQEREDGTPFRPVINESAPIDYVHWRNFGHTPAPLWKDVTAVWRWVFMDRARLIKRFGKEKGERVPLDHSPKQFQDDKQKASVFQQAKIMEVWDKKERKVIWISKGMEEPLDVKDDILGLKDFFPCPKPIYATKTNEKLVPIPDFAQYQDQAKEVDELTERISLLVSALKVAGVYDASAEGLQQLLDNSSNAENKLIPIENWSSFTAKGGLEGVVSWMPIKEVAAALVSLYPAREQAKNDLFEISGVSDIIRGQVDPREKLGQSQIKGQFATLRIEDSQKDVARLARDIVRLKSEIIVEHFDPQNIMAMTNMPEQMEQPEPPAQTEEGILQFQADMQEFEQKTRQKQQEFAQALQLLKDDKLRTFRVDIETDSTIKPDREQDKQDRIEFLTASGTFLGNTLPLAQAQPALVPVLGEMMMFGVRGFRAGRSLEDEFESVVEKLKDSAQQPQQPQEGSVSPEEMAIKQEEIGVKREEMTAKAQLEAQKLELEKRKLQMEGQKMQAEFGIKDRETRVKEGDLSASEFGRDQERIQTAEQNAQQAAQAIQQIAEQLAVMQQGLVEIRRLITAPRTIRRDSLVRQNGRLVGGEVEQGGVVIPVEFS